MNNKTVSPATPPPVARIERPDVSVESFLRREAAQALAARRRTTTALTGRVMNNVDPTDSVESHPWRSVAVASFGGLVVAKFVAHRMPSGRRVSSSRIFTLFRVASLVLTNAVPMLDLVRRLGASTPPRRR